MSAETTERRLVSVLFADLVGFTGIAERRDSEDVRELQSRYFGVCRRLIELYGGVVEKFIGDAVMAVWGTPVATEDDAERAVRASLDLVAAVTALGDEMGVELQARAGVVTGEATVNPAVTGEGMVTGDLVNSAARVQALADPGRVLVGDATRRASEPTVAYEDAGSHELRGKAGLHKLWWAVRVVSGARGALRSEGLESPFVGRDREFRLVKELFQACADEGRPHLVSLTGIAGIGKSRLVWEFFKYVDGLPQIVYWHRGRCLSYGEGVTYWALADMVRMRCRIAEDEDSASGQAKLAEVLDEHVHNADERAFVEPRVSHLLGFAENPDFLREDLFAAWRVFFERLADAYPTVLAFEDMQWADTSLLDFIEYMLDWARTSPIFVMTAARPELVEKRPTWGAGKRHFTSIYLEPLSDTAMRDLLTGLVPGLPGDLRSQIMDRAEGVPLYAMETVRMLLDRGLLVREGSVYQPAGPIDALEVPETLQALIAARLDGLSGPERRVVQDGAVLGKTFSREAVAALSDAHGDKLDPVLTALVRKEVLSIQADPRSPEHGQYGFLQDLVRHVAYEQLSRRERHQRHLAAAAHLTSESGDPGEIVEVLAAHYMAAYATAPDGADVASLRKQALRFLRAAGEHAQGLGATGQARRYFEHAATLTEDPAEQAALFNQAGRMAIRAANLGAAAGLFDQAISVYEQLGDTHAAARVTARRAHVDILGGRMEESVERMERAYAVIADDPPDEDLALLMVRLGRVYTLLGNLDRGLELTDTSLQLAEALDLPEVLTLGWDTRANAAVLSSRPQESRILREAALNIALRTQLTEAAINATTNLSDLAFHRDDYPSALDYLDQAAELARKAGDRQNEWFAFVERSYAHYMLGHWDDALADVADIPGDHLTSFALAGLLSSVLEIHVHRGESDRAAALRQRYVELESSIDPQDASILAGADACLGFSSNRYAEAHAAGCAAFDQRTLLGVGAQGVKQGFIWAVESSLALGDNNTADRLLATVEELPRGLQPPYLRAHAERFRGRLASDHATAGKCYSRGAAQFEQIGITFWQAVTQLEHAESLIASERLADAESLLANALATFQTLTAAPWIERTQAAGRAATQVS